MKILVTGGAGCIPWFGFGRSLLLDHGHSVVVLDNLSSGKREHLENLHRSPHFRFIEGDLLDAELVERSLDGVELVYHMAANPDVKFTAGDATNKDLQQNLLCTYNVLEGMRRQGTFVNWPLLPPRRSVRNRP